MKQTSNVVVATLVVALLPYLVAAHGASIDGQRQKPIVSSTHVEMRQMRIQADASTQSLGSRLEGEEDGRQQLVRQHLNAPLMQLDVAAQGEVASARASPAAPAEEAAEPVANDDAPAITGQNAPKVLQVVPKTGDKVVKEESEESEEREESEEVASNTSVPLSPVVATADASSGGAARAALHARACEDLPLEADDGFGCDAYYVQCTAEHGAVDSPVVAALVQKTHNASEALHMDIPVQVRSSCCSCGGGQTAAAKRFAIGRMQSTMAVKDHPCQWVVAENGEHVWDCNKDGVFLLCKKDSECRTANAVHMLGSDGWSCHTAHGMDEGMCIPANDEPTLHVVHTVPEANGGNFFSVNGHTGAMTAITATGPSARTDRGHPCCCADKLPTSATSMLQAVDVDMQQDPLQDTLALEKKLAGRLKQQLDTMAGIRDPKDLLTAKKHECDGITCTADSCPSSPPVVVVEFQLLAGNGVGYTSGSLDMMRQGRTTCAKDLGSAPCVGVREESSDKETMSWDDRENVMEMVQLETSHPAPPDPSLPMPTKEEMPKVPTCEEMGGHCEQEATSYVLFLVDMSASATSDSATRKFAAKDVGRAYSQLCDKSDKDEEDEAKPTGPKLVPGKMFCGLYAFDGSAHLTAIAPFAGSKESAALSRQPSREEVQEALLGYQVEDKSTNLLGALVSANELLASRAAEGEMTALTVVLVTDGQERTHRFPLDVAQQSFSSSKVDTYVMFIDHDAPSPAAEEGAAVLAAAEQEHRQKMARAGKQEYDEAMKEWRRQHEQKGGEAFICLDILQLPNADCCTKGSNSDSTARKCTAVHPPSETNEQSQEEEDLAAEEKRLQESSDTLQGEVAQDATDLAKASKEGVHGVAALVADRLRSQHMTELAEVKARMAKHRKAVARAQSAIKARENRFEVAEAQFEEDSKAMMSSWRKHLVVQQSLFSQSHYLMAFCSSFRAGIKQTDHRKGSLLVASATTPAQHVGFDFSSATFRNPHCTHQTLMAAIGIARDNQLVGAEAPIPAAGTATEERDESTAVVLAASQTRPVAAAASTPKKAKSGSERVHVVQYTTLAAILATVWRFSAN